MWYTAYTNSMPRASDAKKMTAAEYLDFEAKAQVKHEFVDGFVFAMAGAGNAHNLISGNIFAQVRLAARDSACRAYISDMKLAVSDDTYYYPDVFVTCDDLDANIKQNACFVVEILSDSTSDIDRGEKLRNYRKLSSLQAYILVSQKNELVEVYRRLDDGSWRHDIVEEGSIELPCLGLELSLEDIYEDVFEN